jgi:nucleotide-binding universal stress UspA family protein
MYSKILVPFDGSEHAVAALKYAKELAALVPGTTIDVVTALTASAIGVEPGTSTLGYDQYKAMLDKGIAWAKDGIVEKFGAELEGDNITVEVVAGSGAALAISKYCADHGCDLIVMGRRGLGAVRGMLGSVSFAILREAEVPVITVK